jgi:transposase
MGWSGRAPALPARQAGKGTCLIGMEACTGAHHLSRKLQALGHDARLMPTNYVRPYSKGDKNDYRDAEAIAEAIMWSRHSRRSVPMSLSAYPFCQGEPGAMGLSRIPMARNRRVTAAP